MKKNKNSQYKNIAAQADDAIKRWQKRTEKIKQEEQSLSASGMVLPYPGSNYYGIPYPGSNYYGMEDVDYDTLKAENEALKKKIEAIEKGKECMTLPMEEIIKTPRKFKFTGG